MSKFEQKSMQQTIARNSRANALIRLASSFNGIELENYPTKTKEGYEAVIKLLLCYSAAEELGEAIQKKITKWNLSSIRLAPKLRALFIKEESTQGLDDDQRINYQPLVSFLNKKTQQQLDEFQSGKNDNIRVPATVLRHLIAHGSLTLNGLQIRSKTSIATINSLSDLLVLNAKREFETWLYWNCIIDESDRS